MSADLAPAKKIFLSPSNPILSARTFLQSLRTPDGDDTLRFYVGDWFLWEGFSYRMAEAEEIRRRLYLFLEEAWTKVKAGDDEEKEQPFQPTKTKVDQVMDALRAECFLRSVLSIPSWLDGRKAEPRECLSCRNGIIHLPTFADGGRHYIESPTPVYFSTCALPFAFAADAPPPETWLKFLADVFESDGESIACLQEWMGYCLTPDTRHHKMLLLYGPPRGGKGTIARILTALLGAQNVANPTLCGLMTNFGLWPLIGKAVAIIGDARLSGRSDQAVITERLLSITGEDSLTIDKKNREPVTVRLFSRLMLLTNELPRLADASGALASRFVILRLRQSFLGREDTELERRLLAELPGILIWAIEGWRRLRQQGRFIVPTSSAEAVQELVELSSPVTAFVRERCTIEAGWRVEVGDLFREWQSWCTGQGREHAGNVQTFGRDLTAAYPFITTSRPRVGGVRVREYRGIGVGNAGGGE